MEKRKADENKKRASPVLMWLLVAIMSVSIIFVLTFAAISIVGKFYGDGNSLAQVQKISAGFGRQGSPKTSVVTAVSQSEKSSGGAFKNYAYFEFSFEQREELANFAEQNAAAVSVLVSKAVAGEGNEAGGETSSADDFAFGFLHDDDFSADGTLQAELLPRPIVSADFSKLSGGEEFYFSMAFDTVPRGFFVYSAAEIFLNGVEYGVAFEGWHKDGDVQKYGFGTNGGAARDGYEVTFSELISGDKNGVARIFFAAPDVQSASGVQQKIGVDVAGNVVQVRLAGGKNYVDLPASAFSFGAAGMTRLSVTGGKNTVTGITAFCGSRVSLADGLVQPHKADPGLILRWERKNWRRGDYEVFEWDRFAGVYVFDFADYEVQNDYLRRLAFFVEKAGFRGKLLTDEELAGRHAYNAHDYSAQSLANFFEKARSENFLLNRRELHLRDFLLANGVIFQQGDGEFVAGKGAIVSISQESSSALRVQLLAHEGWHGIFFVDEAFRQKAREIFDEADRRSIKFMVGYFSTYPSLNYDMSDTTLMINEFMSYMLERPVSGIAPYFAGTLANRAAVQKTLPDDAAYVRGTNASWFTEASAKFDKYVYERWRLNAGRVWLVER